MEIDTIKIGKAISEQALRLLRSFFLLPRETLSISSLLQILPISPIWQQNCKNIHSNANRVEVTDAEHKTVI